MKRRSWIIVGDLVIVKPWAVEADKADVLFRYTKTQKSYLSRRRMLPQSME
jgi:translation initiation factor 1A